MTSSVQCPPPARDEPDEMCTAFPCFDQPGASCQGQEHSENALVSSRNGSTSSHRSGDQHRLYLSHDDPRCRPTPTRGEQGDGRRSNPNAEIAMISGSVKPLTFQERHAEVIKAFEKEFVSKKLSSSSSSTSGIVNTVIGAPSRAVDAEGEDDGYVQPKTVLALKKRNEALQQQDTKTDEYKNSTDFPQLDRVMCAYREPTNCKSSRRDASFIMMDTVSPQQQQALATFRFANDHIDGTAMVDGKNVVVISRYTPGTTCPSQRMATNDITPFSSSFSSSSSSGKAKAPNTNSRGKQKKKDFRKQKDKNRQMKEESVLCQHCQTKRILTATNNAINKDNTSNTLALFSSSSPRRRDTYPKTGSSSSSNNNSNNNNSNNNNNCYTFNATGSRDCPVLPPIAVRFEPSGSLPACPNLDHAAFPYRHHRDQSGVTNPLVVYPPTNYTDHHPHPHPHPPPPPLPQPNFPALKKSTIQPILNQASVEKDVAAAATQAVCCHGNPHDVPEAEMINERQLRKHVIFLVVLSAVVTVSVVMAVMIMTKALPIDSLF